MAQHGLLLEYSVVVGCYIATGVVIAALILRGRRDTHGHRMRIRPPSLHPFLLWAQASTEVENLFRKRRGHWFFHLKGGVGLAALLLIVDRTRSILEILLGTREEFDEQVSHLIPPDTRFYAITPAILMGYAARNEDSQEIVLGLAHWVLGKGPFSSSAADHELTHCVQDKAAGLFDWEWRAARDWSSASCAEKLWITGTLLTSELHAMAFGSMLLCVTGMLASFWPLGLYFLLPDPHVIF